MGKYSDFLLAKPCGYLFYFKSINRFFFLEYNIKKNEPSVRFNIYFKEFNYNTSMVVVTSKVITMSNLAGVLETVPVEVAVI